jgi:CubicO group peptidase (beta-lactamase class C family)
MPPQSVAHSASIATFIPDLERLIAETMDEWKIPGLAMTVVSNGEGALVGAYGLRDVEAGLKVTTDTQFLICSITKSFTSTGLSLLMDERRLDRKKAVRDYTPKFRLHGAVATDRITVRDLLCYHSGLPRHDWIWMPADLSRANAGGNALSRTERRHLQCFPYQNLGYLVAGMVAERVSGDEMN